MLGVVNLEEIQGALLRVPALVRILDERGPGFAAAAKEWMIQVERILQDNRLAVAAEIAALRGTLISAERGAMPAGLVFNGRPSARKVREAAAADVVRKAESAISNAIRDDAARCAEGERLAQQIVAVALRKRIAPMAGQFSLHGDMLRALWRTLVADAELSQAATHLAGLVGPQDALILLDRKLPPLA